MNAIEQRIRDAERRLFAHYDVSVTEHNLDLRVGDSPLRVRVLEAGAGSPIVLLHPGTWFGAHWAPLLPHLPQHRLLCVDLPGSGLSGGVDYRKHDFRPHTVGMLQQLWSALGLRTAPILGNSQGGLYALWLAAADPSLVSHLVIFGAPAFALHRGGLAPVFRLMAIPGLGRLILMLPSSPERSRRLSKGMMGPAVLARTPREAFEIHHLAGRRPEFALTLTTLIQASLRWFSPLPHLTLTDAEIAGLHQPARFIWGDRDPGGGPEVAERAVEQMQNAALVVHEGGHFPHLEEPERYGTLVSDFLSD